MSAADAGRLLEHLRTEAGLSTAQVAAAAGFTSHSWIRRTERTGRPTRRDTLVRLAHAIADLSDGDRDATVAALLEAADGDHAPGDRPARRPDPARARRQAAIERARSQLAELHGVEGDPDAFLAWVRETFHLDDGLGFAADLLSQPDEPGPLEPNDGGPR